MDAKTTAPLLGLSNKNSSIFYSSSNFINPLWKRLTNLKQNRTTFHRRKEGEENKNFRHTIRWVERGRAKIKNLCSHAWIVSISLLDQIISLIRRQAWLNVFTIHTQISSVLDQQKTLLFTSSFLCVGSQPRSSNCSHDCCQATGETFYENLCFLDAKDFHTNNFSLLRVFYS